MVAKRCMFLDMFFHRKVPNIMSGSHPKYIYIYTFKFLFISKKCGSSGARSVSVVWRENVRSQKCGR